MKDLQTTKNKLKEAFDLVAKTLVVEYPERVRCAYKLIDANESAIALEIMCSNLHEFECRIPIKAYELFAEVGVDLNVNSKYWEALKPYVVG
jgi:hypothetical protein